MQEEIWKDIEGYEGIYQVSNLGRVRSLTRKVDCKGGQRTIKGKILKPIISFNSYLSVDLRQHQKHKTALIHRLVAQAFIPNPNDFPIVNHIDNNPQNNCANNLEWCTQSYNVKYSYIYGNAKPTLGCFKKGNIPHNLRKIVQYDKNHNFIRIHNSIRLAAKSVGRTDGAIQNCLAGKTKTSGGYIWKYAD